VTSSVSESEVATGEPGRAGQYLLLSAAETDFALPILAVREIIEPTETTRVPRAHPALMGLTNLRGLIIPVLDLALRLNLTAARDSAKRVFIVIDVVSQQGMLQRGLMVDTLGGIIEVAENNVRAYDAVSAQIPREFIAGVLPGKDRFAFLLDLERLFAIQPSLGA
jgi:purine-binding chemotaxis protein CheW